jgi:hypothetical protein
MRNSLTFVSFLTAIAFAGCTGGDGDGDAGTEVTGQGVYRDSTTEHDGTSKEPAAPPAQDVQVEITVEGTGTIPNPDPQCALDAVGAFEAVFTGTAVLDEGGAYLGAMGAGSGSITTPSGCVIPELTVGAITDVTVRVELEATTENCDTYCAASARADAEAECGATADQATCRENAEATAVASCTTTCTQQSDAIVAEVSLGASALGSLDADALRAAALGEVQADLVFDEAQ